MKKLQSILAVILSASVLFTAAAPMTAFAARDEITKKELTAYLYALDKTKKIECVFTGDLPDVPYITAEDYLSCVFSGEFTGTKNMDGIYSVNSPNGGAMIVNTDKNTVFLGEDQHFLAGMEPENDDTLLDAPYCKPVENKKESSGAADFLIEFEKYSIDLLEVDGKAYFPLPTVSDLFVITNNAGEYCNGNLYFVHAANEMVTQESYFDKSSVYSSTKRTPEMIQYTYNEFCFVIDELYGRPSSAKIAASIEEKGFDKTLDEYSDESRRAKQLLLSDNTTDMIFGLCSLSKLFWDGGHTAFNACVADLQKYMTAPVFSDLITKMQDPTNPDASLVMDSAQDGLNLLTQINSLSSLRSGEYARYEMVKTWDGEAKAFYLRSNDTGVFVFDSFMNDAVDDLKWALDHAKSNGIKQFIIDVTCNTGGSNAVLCYMMGIITNKDHHTNINSFSYLDMTTGGVEEEEYYIDYNLDGKFDDLDKDVVYDFDFAVLASRNSFSCGNLLPVMAKAEGIAVLGERSGGGSCGVACSFTPERMAYTMSGSIQFSDKNGSDVDLGAEPDVVLGDASSGDYAAFYDVDKLGSLTKNHYSPEQTSQQSQPEGSESLPSQTETSQEGSSREESFPVRILNETDGTNLIAVWVIAGLLPVAAFVFCMILSVKAKKSRKTDKGEN